MKANERLTDSGRTPRTHRRTKAEAQAWNLKSTAYHEAGHAVAAFWLRCGTRYVTIKPDPEEGTLGHHRANPFGKAFQPDLNSDSITRATAERRIMVCLAGQIAEARFRGRRNNVGARSDNHAAVDLALYFTGSTKETGAFVDWLSARTENLFGLFLWRAVEVLAAALLERQTISGPEARKIIRDAIRRLPESSNA